MTWSPTGSLRARPYHPHIQHASIQTTSRYLAEVADEPAGVADVLDRRHQRLRRERGHR